MSASGLLSSVPSWCPSAETHRLVPPVPLPFPLPSPISMFWSGSILNINFASGQNTRTQLAASARHRGCFPASHVSLWWGDFLSKPCTCQGTLPHMVAPPWHCPVLLGRPLLSLTAGVTPLAVPASPAAGRALSLSRQTLWGLAAHPRAGGAPWKLI